MTSRDDELLAWAGRAVRQTWAGGNIKGSHALRGDLSTRRFWRTVIDGGLAPTSAILIDLGPDDLPGYARALNLVAEPLSEPPWLTVHRFLASLGAPVPAMYATDTKLRAMLVEDVGEISLVDAARGNPSQTADLFRMAVELLLQLHVEGTRALPGGILPAKIAYDQRLFRWEFKEFLDFGCAELGADAAALFGELDALTSRLGRLPRVFSHRDFHGQNLFVQPTPDGIRLRLIDFQDALMAPAAQDLAVLLTTRDMATLVSPGLERRLLEFYYSGLVRRGAANLSIDELFSSYQLCVLQHALKMIGRFRMFEHKGKPGYSVFVPRAVEQARRILGGAAGGDFPRLAVAFSATGPALTQ